MVQRGLFPFGMTPDIQHIDAAIRQWLSETLLPADEVATLTSHTTLAASGILDSISTLELVSFLERTFGIEFAAHDVTKANLESIDSVSRVVSAKLAQRG